MREDKKLYQAVSCEELGYPDVTATVWVNLSKGIRNQYFESFARISAAQTPDEMDSAEAAYEDAICQIVKDITVDGQTIVIDSREAINEAFSDDDDAQLLAFVIDAAMILFQSRYAKAKDRFRKSIS